MCGYELGRTCCIVDSLTDDAQLGQRLLALCQGLLMADDPLQVLFLYSRQGQKAVVHWQLHLPHNVKTVAQQKIAIPVNGSSERILDREDRSVHQPQLERLESGVELLARDCLASWVSFRCGGLAVSTWNSLVGYSQSRSVARLQCQVGVGRQHLG
ncbi:hypothetical protein Mapa_014927 [Marchantia paleacea]|nr:hypothetical protein Mapa_014927 [Marchantia paleacea]